MPPRPDPRYDVASAMARGRRDYQEDALASDFQVGTGFGFVVLSDGMGGHAAGDIASKIVVTEIFCELKFQSGDTRALQSNITAILREAVQAANSCVHAHAQANPKVKGMGATLVAPVLIGRKLHWISIGDSPLFLYRGGRLRQLNEDHSLAPQIDLMVESGLMSAEIGRNHPDRNALTSVLFGDEIERIDCPEEPVELAEGDIVIAASDGLQFLPNETIAAILSDCRNDSSETIVETLMQAIADLDDPDQDNVSIAVIRYRDRSAAGTSADRPVRLAGAAGGSAFGGHAARAMGGWVKERRTEGTPHRKASGDGAQ